MRWEEMDKGHTELGELVRQFQTHCRLEGKPDTTTRWYGDILGRYLRWAPESRLDDFTLEKKHSGAVRDTTKRGLVGKLLDLINPF